MPQQPQDNPQGKDADSPTEIPAKGWWQITKRVIKQIKSDQIQIVSAGISFYLFLSLFPILAATVAIYGLVTDPSEAENQISNLKGLIPSEAYDVVGKMIRNIASESGATLGWSVLLSLLFSIWSANKGTKALVTGLNIAYDEREERGFFRLTLTTLALTLGTFLTLAVTIALVAGIPAVIGSLGLPENLATTIAVIRWPILAALICVVLACLYRWAPDRDAANWKWVSPGALIAAGMWLAGSALFSVYVENFSSMSKTYGPFAAVVTLMLWLFLTSFIILLGAEINSESEHQTAKDSTKGSDEPMGYRGAHHADHVVGNDGKSDKDEDDFL